MTTSDISGISELGLDNAYIYAKETQSKSVLMTFLRNLDQSFFRCCYKNYFLQTA